MVHDGSGPQAAVVADTPRRPRVSLDAPSELQSDKTSFKANPSQSSETSDVGSKSDSACCAEAFAGSTNSVETPMQITPVESLPSSTTPDIVSSEPFAASTSTVTADGSRLEAAAGGEGETLVKAFSKENCAGCMQGLVHNLHLRRSLAKVTYRLQKASETQQTHGQRILRAYYEHKLTELGRGQHRYATQVLNQQKKCFEEELDQVEAEARMREASLRAQLEQERARTAAMVKAFERERDAVVAKTEETISCLQRKLNQGLSRSSNLEWENAHLIRSLSEKSALVEALIANAEASEENRRRADVMSKASVDERVRKDRVINALESEVRDLRQRLSTEAEINAQLLQAIETIEGNRDNDRVKYIERLSECRTESKKDIDKLGRLVSSLIQDFVDAERNVSKHPEGSKPGMTRDLQ